MMATHILFLNTFVYAVHMVPCEGRLIQLWMYYRNGNPDDNHYAHPLDFIPVVDLNLKKVCTPAMQYLGSQNSGFCILACICACTSTSQLS